DIAAYNTFVTAAANTVPELTALGTNWAVIGSTATVTARDNTNTNPSGQVGNPIFDTAGHLVASNNAALWSGSIAVPLSTTETGGTSSVQAVWTGTNASGVQSSTNVLGGSVPTIGYSTATTGAWINWTAS